MKQGSAYAAKQEKERCRKLAQRLAGAVQPGTARVVGGDEMLDKALAQAGIQPQENGPAELLVVMDLGAELPQDIGCTAVLLDASAAAELSLWAQQLAEQGFYRDFAWIDSDQEHPTVLFRAAVPEMPQLAASYERELDALRAQLEHVRRGCAGGESMLERLNKDLQLSRSHAQTLEATLNEVTGSTCWRMTWPLRYVMSKAQQICAACPPLAFLMEARRLGFAGAREQARMRRLYATRFPGQTLAADVLAPRELLMRQAARQPDGPKISIVVPLCDTPRQYLEEMLDSVQNQTYANWELVCVDAGQEQTAAQAVQARAAHDSRIRWQKLAENRSIADNTNAGFALAQGEYIALLDHDDVLHPCALWYVAQAIAQQGADFVYTDEATFENSVQNVVLYHFKPDFMLDNLRSNNYICHLTVFRKELMERAGGGEREEYDGAQDYDLFLRLTEQARKIVHVPHALYYWRSSPGSTAAGIRAKSYSVDAGVSALFAHYQRMGEQVDNVSLIAGTPGYYKTDYVITRPGRVSILIPTCDHIGDLETCIASIYARTTYPDFEIILIENNSREARTFRAYERMQKEHPENLRVVTWQGKGFNYSALNNFGVQYATGEYLLLLNNDTEVITPHWLEEMVMYAQQKRVGCVGVKLFYPDDTIQHAGVGFGLGGVAGHLHRFFPGDSDGYMGRLVYAQDLYVVTAACLMVRREVYDQVDGLDESFAVAFNDVDFCVRVRKAGYQNVFTPFAQLYHYESKSRGLDEAPEKRKRYLSEVERFQTRWKAELAEGDPCMNPNFDISREDFGLKILPLE
ncbi:MAG: glycosyltransferase [Faecalibacterium sp.]